MNHRMMIAGKLVQYHYSTHLKHIIEDYSAETIKGSNSSGMMDRN